MRELMTSLAVLGVATVLIYLLLVAGGGDVVTVESAGGPWNLILLTLDTLRADHLGCYGYFRETSPAIDRLAGESAVFDNAIIPSPFTAPSHATMLTGLYPAGHGVLTNGYRLVSANRSLAEVLRDSGYRTAGFVAARRVLGRRFGFGQGFEVFEEGEADQRRAAEVNREVTAWLETLGDGERFFAWIHYYDIHCDYQAPEPWFELFCPGYGGDIDPHGKCGKSYYNSAELDDEDLDYVRSLYDGEIRYVDEQISGLLDRLAETGLLHRTIIVITSDHGESLGERGLVGHNLCLYDYEIRVPLIIRHPGLAAAPSRIGNLVSTASLMPSLLELLGIAHHGDLDETSFAGLLHGRPRRPSFGFSHTAPEGQAAQLFSIRTRDRKLILNPDGRQEFYSLNNGVEQDPPAGDRDQSAEQLRNALSRWILHREERASGKGQAVSDEVKQQLKALGYVNQ